MMTSSRASLVGGLPSLPGELWIKIFAWLGDDDVAAARAAATCREWRQHVRDGYGARYTMAVQIARVFLGGLPRVDASSTGTHTAVRRSRRTRDHERLLVTQYLLTPCRATLMTSDDALSITRIHDDDDEPDDEADVDAEGKPRKHVMLRGRTCAELATAEEALRSVVPTVALCNGRLPTFLRSMYAVTGGQEADGQEYCKQGLLHEHDGVSKYGVLCPLPSEVGFTYGGYFCYQTVSLRAWLGSDYEPTLSGEYPDLHGDGTYRAIHE